MAVSAFTSAVLRGDVFEVAGWWRCVVWLWWWLCGGGGRSGGWWVVGVGVEVEAGGGSRVGGFTDAKTA